MESKEEILDEQITPLMEQVLEICREHGIPIYAVFQYAEDDERLHLAVSALNVQRFLNGQLVDEKGELAEPHEGTLASEVLKYGRKVCKTTANLYGESL